MKVSVSTPAGTPVRAAISPVTTPSPMASRLAFSSLSANAVSSAMPSSSPRFRSAPVQANSVAIGFVEVLSPFCRRYQWRVTVPWAASYSKQPDGEISTLVISASAPNAAPIISLITSPS